MQYVYRDLSYLHGDNNEKNKYNGPSAEVEAITRVPADIKSEWRSTERGIIPCPPQWAGGCGEGILELNCILPDNWVSRLLYRAGELAGTQEFENLPNNFECSCLNLLGENATDSDKLRKAASRHDTVDNVLYCPTAKDLQHDDIKHFQWHWSKGEPVIVSDVLENALGLSWEPNVMWRAFRQKRKSKQEVLLDVTAINCLDWCEVRHLFLCFFFFFFFFPCFIRSEVFICCSECLIIHLLDFYMHGRKSVFEMWQYAVGMTK